MEKYGPLQQVNERANHNRVHWNPYINLFKNMVAVAFFFHSEMHQNNIFFIFKKLFLTAAHQND